MQYKDELSDVFSTHPLEMCEVIQDLYERSLILPKTEKTLLVQVYTHFHSSSILLKALQNEIERDPEKFHRLIEVLELSKQERIKEIVENLRSTHKTNNCK